MGLNRMTGDDSELESLETLSLSLVSRVVVPGKLAVIQPIVANHHRCQAVCRVARSRQVCTYIVEALLITIYLPEERADTYRH
jgi:hypothetical protein